MRLLNRPLAFILAAALAVAAIIVIIEVIGFEVHKSPVVLHWTTWYHWAKRTHWDQLVIEVWSAILMLIGLLILAVELKPRRVTRLRLRSDQDATDAALTRAGLTGTLRAAATSVDGVSAAAVTVRRRRARVIALAAARGKPATEALNDPVSQAVHDRLTQLDLRHPPHLKVRVNSRSR
jgi:Ni/Fe-hydrogenase subunit HybB-like protein